MNSKNTRVPSSSGDATRNQSRKRKKRRIRRMRVAVLFFIIVLIVAGVIVAFLMYNKSANIAANNSNQNQVIFGVKSIAVEGSTKYSSDEIIEASGIYIGQSVFFVQKREAAENILRDFPYVEKVTVDNSSFSEINISIVEAEPVGVVQVDNNWIVISETGKGLESLSADSTRLSDYLQLQSNILDGSGVGTLMLSDRSLTVISTLLNAFGSYGLSDVKSINLADFTDIRLNWKNQITILLGNDSNLDREISVVVTALDRVLKQHTDSACGQLNLSTYSNTDTDDNQIVFTPQDVLESTTTTTTAG